MEDLLDQRTDLAVSQADDFFDEYEARAQDVQRSRHSSFAHNLKRWFAALDSHPIAAAEVRNLEGAVNFAEWYAAAEETVGSMVGSGDLDWPGETRPLLGMQLCLFRTFARREMDASDFAANFLWTENHYDTHVADIVDQIFDPLYRDLRRLLERRFRRTDVSHDLAPASDRTVRLDHNSADYQALVDAICRVEGAVREANDYPDADDKAQRLAELGAGKRLLSAPQVRLGAIWATIGAVLVFLTTAFADQIISNVADIAWKKFAAFFGIG